MPRIYVGSSSFEGLFYSAVISWSTMVTLVFLSFIGSDKILISSNCIVSGGPSKYEASGSSISSIDFRRYGCECNGSMAVVTVV